MLAVNDPFYLAAPVVESVLDALRNYEVRPVPWSQRAQAAKELAA